MTPEAPSSYQPLLIFQGLVNLITSHACSLFCDSQWPHASSIWVNPSCGTQFPVTMFSWGSNSHSFVSDPVAGFVASSFKAWVRASFEDLLPPMGRCCFTSWLFIDERIGCLPLDEALRQLDKCPVGQLLNDGCKSL